MTVDAAISEARARIIWGETSLSVRDFLLSNGISEVVAEAKITEFVIERAAEIRRRGIKEMVVGGTVLGAVCAVLFYLMFAYGTRFVIVWFARGFVLLALIGFYGIWKLWHGVMHLALPRSEHKAISDLSK